MYPYLELFWCAFSRILTAYREIFPIYPYSVQMREIQTRITQNTDTFYAVDEIVMTNPIELDQIEVKWYERFSSLYWLLL